MALPNSERFSPSRMFLTICHAHYFSSYWFYALWRLIFTESQLVLFSIPSGYILFGASITVFLTLWIFVTVSYLLLLGEFVSHLSFPTVANKCLIHFRHPINDSNWTELKTKIQYTLYSWKNHGGENTWENTMKRVTSYFCPGDSSLPGR